MRSSNSKGRSRSGPAGDVDDEVVIHSYRDVFRTSWRIHRINFAGTVWWVPSPEGVKVSTAAWFFGTAFVLWIVARLPVVGEPVGWVPFLVRYLIVPFYVAFLASRKTPDGRSFHRYAWSRLRLKLRARPARMGPVRVPVLHDGSSAVVQPGRVAGPARVTFNRPVRTRATWNGHVVAQADEGGRTFTLDVEPGRVLEIRA